MKPFNCQNPHLICLGSNVVVAAESETQWKPNGFSLSFGCYITLRFVLGAAAIVINHLIMTVTLTFVSSTKFLQVVHD